MRFPLFLPTSRFAAAGSTPQGHRRQDSHKQLGLVAGTAQFIARSSWFPSDLLLLPLMKPSLQLSISSLIADISRGLSFESPHSAELPELLLAGLALRRGIPPSQVRTLLPQMSALRCRLGLSRALTHPNVSVWYFANLEIHEPRFELLCESYRDELETCLAN